MDKRHRQVLFYDLTVETKTRSKTAVSQLTMLEVLSEIYKYSNYIGPIAFDNKTLWLTVQEWQVNGNEHHLLVNKSDSNKSDPTFSKPLTNTRRTIPKEDGEGNETSSHVVIKIDANNPQKALILIERGALASTSRLTTVFSKGLRTVKAHNPEFLQQVNIDGSCDKNGKPNMVNLYLDFEADAHLSDSFIEDLKAGRFLDAILTNEKGTNHVVDGHDQFVVDMEYLKIAPSPTSSVSFAGLKNLFKSKSSKFEKARIRFKKLDGSVKETDVDTAAFKELSYIKKEYIASDGIEFGSAYAKIEPLTIKKMKALC